VAELAKVLVANRGEIAVRIIRAARDAGLASVAVYADSDARARHVRMADESCALVGTSPAETYLSVDAILAAARQTGADAVHPGYGFLAESADFAQAVVSAGLTWIGPPAHAIRNLGDKVSARRIALRAGAPLVPGTADPVSGAPDITAFAAEYGLPVAIKAAFGGGGRGFRVAATMAEIPGQYESARREALAAFGRGECYAERYLDRPRHVEAQVLADRYGAVVVAGTRDCTLQRRHQKLVEEAPAPFLTAQQRALLHESAQAICREAGYEGAGTVEFLLGRDGTISFLEVNTRLQVEHPVTEETTGIDLVRETFRIAAGEPLRLTGDPAPHGHAFEFRINAEDPARDFLPAPGRITRLVLPEGPGVRVDSGVEAGDEVDGRFDSMLAKLIVTGADREEALERSRRALDELAVEGITTVASFHRAAVRDPAFTAAGPDGFAVHTRWIETEYSPPAGKASPEPTAEHVVGVTIGGRRMAVRLPGLAALGPAARAMAARGLEPRGLEPRGLEQGADGGTRRTAASRGNAVTAPMQGTVTTIAAAEGQPVQPGDVIAVVEAMKMENPVTAHRAGTVTGLRVAAGDAVTQDQVICELT
jgi:acetyl-CoA/propionyl-CoA carboxylase biotin carboxyl carrier protein